MLYGSGYNSCASKCRHIKKCSGTRGVCGHIPPPPKKKQQQQQKTTMTMTTLFCPSTRYKQSLVASHSFHCQHQPATLGLYKPPSLVPRPSSRPLTQKQNKQYKSYHMSDVTGIHLIERGCTQQPHPLASRWS